MSDFTNMFVSVVLSKMLFSTIVEILLGIPEGLILTLVYFMSMCYPLPSFTGSEKSN